MLTLILKSNDIYKVDSVANRISLSLPYEHQMEIDPSTLVTEKQKGPSSEFPIPRTYTLPIKFGMEEEVNVEFVINLDVDEVYTKPSTVAVSTVQKKNCITQQDSKQEGSYEVKDTDLMGDAMSLRRYT